MILLAELIFIVFYYTAVALGWLLFFGLIMALYFALVFVGELLMERILK